MAENGIRVPDGLEGVVVTDTALSEIDGAAGRLTYRGIPIAEVVSRFPRWEDLLPWLVYGNTFAYVVAEGGPMGSSAAEDPLRELMRLVLTGPREFERAEQEAGWLASLPARLVGRKPQDFPSAATAYLSGLRGVMEVPDSEVRALNAYWVMAAEHSLNASTFAVRVAASTGTNLCLALVAGLATLAGPLHGGAPLGVLRLMDEAGEMDNQEDWLRGKVLRGERLMGFGHRVYRAQDPRAEALREVFNGLAHDHEAVARAIRLEEAALRVLAEEKPSRALHTNVEFYAAAVMRALAIPIEWCPVTFALARLAGWTAHYHEQQERGRLIRPLAQYRPN